MSFYSAVPNRAFTLPPTEDDHFLAMLWFGSNQSECRSPSLDRNTENMVPMDHISSKQNGGQVHRCELLERLFFGKNAINNDLINCIKATV